MGEMLRMQYLPEIAPTFTEQAPVIDGKLNDLCWASATRGGDFFIISSSNPATTKTSVRMCYDSRHLYIAFECSQPKMEEINIRHTKEDGPIWLDESVEIFISPFAVPDKHSIHHFVVNAGGVKRYMFGGRRMNRSEKWRAATFCCSNQWTAEVVIPFDMLKPFGRNEDCWRINFCRNARLPKEESSWAMLPNKTNSIRRYGKLLQPQSSPRFIGFRSKLELHPPDSVMPGTVDIHEVPDPPQTRDLIIPQPRLMRYVTANGLFAVDESTRIVIGHNASEISVRAAEELNDELSELLGYTLQVVRDNQISIESDGVILIGRPDEHSVLRRLLEQEKLKITSTDPGPEGYLLDVNPKRIALIGADSLGVFWGVQTLKQLIKARGEKAEAPSVFIRDWPRFSFRGVHLPTFKNALPFYEKLIEKVLSRFKINQIVLQTDVVDWSCRPELSDPDVCMAKEDVSALIEIARHHCIEVVPMVGTPGHLEWAFRDNNNVEIAEDKENPHCYCPSNPKSYDLIFGIIDEAVELFGHPKYVHTGRDDFDTEGRFPVDDECRKRGKEEVFIQDTIKIHDHLKKKGCTMVVWGDILAKDGYQNKLDRIPKDIIIADKRSVKDAHASLDYYLQHEFQVIGSPSPDPKNIYALCREAAQKNAFGILQATITGFDSEENALSRHNDDLYAYILAAGWSWNPSWPPIDKMPYEPDIAFRQVWNRQKVKSGDSSWFSVCLGSHCNVSTHDSARTLGWLGLGKGNDLRKVPAGTNNMGGTPHVLEKGAIGKASAILLNSPGVAEGFPSEVRDIQVERNAHALHFLHTSAWPEDHGAEAGEYIVRYEDGVEEHIPLVYGCNISSWTDRSPVDVPQLAWRGQTADGHMVRLESYGWENPHPQKQIKSIDFLSAGSQCSPVLLSITGEIKKDIF